MSCSRQSRRGFTLLEIMVALTLGVLLLGPVIGLSLTQSQVYKSSHSQASIQNAENAISALLVPTVRAAGFIGCGALASAVSNLIPGGPPPLGALNSTPAMLAGFDSIGTAGPSSSWTIGADNQANELDATRWSPALDSSLAGHVLPGSDVLIVLSAAPGSQPVAAAGSVAGSNSVSAADTSSFSIGQIVAVSDCLKSSIFSVTGISSNTLVHAAGSGAMANATAALSLNFAPGAQLVSVQQTAFFVAHGTAGQSVLMRATWTGTTWKHEPIVPGIDSMQVLYGIGTAADGVIARYVPASAVPDWTLVHGVHLAFLIQGRPGSAARGGMAAPVLLGTTVTPPADTRLRRVYELTVHLRNAGL